MVLRAQTEGRIVRVVGVGGEFEFLARIGVHADAHSARDDARTCTKGIAARADLCVEFIAAANVVDAEGRVHPLRLADIEVEVRAPVVRLAAVHGIDLRRDLDVLQSSHESVRLVRHRARVVDEGARVLLRLLVARDRLNALRDPQHTLGGLRDVRECLFQILCRLRICADGLEVRHDALDARRGLCEVCRHGVHIGKHFVQIAAILRRHLLKRRSQPVEMRRHMLHVDDELDHRGLEAGRADDVVDGGEHCLDLNNHLVQLGEHGVHAHLVRAVEVVTARVEVRARGRRDDDEFVPHDAGLTDGDGGAARNLHTVLNDEGDGDTRTVIHDLLDVPDRDAGEEHLRLGVQPDGTPEARIDRIVMPAAKPQSAKEHNDGNEKRRASECKCADLCLSTHAPASLRWCSVRKNACTRSSFIS